METKSWKNGLGSEIAFEYRLKHGPVGLRFAPSIYTYITTHIVQMTGIVTS